MVVTQAWGVSKFSTIEQLEKEGAYSRAEDKYGLLSVIWPLTVLRRIAFGCLIFPIR